MRIILLFEYELKSPCKRPMIHQVDVQQENQARRLIASQSPHESRVETKTTPLPSEI